MIWSSVFFKLILQTSKNIPFLYSSIVKAFLNAGLSNEYETSFPV